MPYSHPDDESMMKRALHLGEKARILAPPNPWVGCLIVKNGLAPAGAAGV